MKSKKATIQIDQSLFERNENRIVGKLDLKFRKTWEISPVVRIHGEKSKKKKTRRERKDSIRKALLGEIDE